MTDDQLRQQSAEFRKRLAAGEQVDDLLIEAFAACRESGRRYLNMRHFRRPVDRRHDSARRQYRRNGHRRRQNPGRHAAGLS